MIKKLAGNIRRYSVLTAAVTGLLLGANAFSALNVISEVYEVKASAVNISGARVTVLTCEECQRISLKVSDQATRFVVKKNGKVDDVAKADFSKLLMKLDNRGSLVVVFYDPKTKVISELRLSL